MLWLNRLSRTKTNLHFSSFLDEKNSQSEIPKDFPEDLSNDLNLLHQEKQWRRSVSTPGSLVTHDSESWTGKVIELRGDPVNGGKVLVEHPVSFGPDQGFIVQRFYSALSLNPVMKVVSPFRQSFKEMNWIQKMSQQKVLIIARGPSGSGKSYMVKQISEKYDAPIFASDDFWMVNGKYQFDHNYLDEAHSWNQGRVEESVQGNVPIVIVDNTNGRFWEMKPYIKIAQKYGYNVIFKEPDWNEQLKTSEGKWNVDFLEKMQNQPDREKKVPHEVIESMVKNYEYSPTIENVLNSEKPD